MPGIPTFDLIKDHLRGSMDADYLRTTRHVITERRQMLEEAEGDHTFMARPQVAATGKAESGADGAQAPGVMRRRGR